MNGYELFSESTQAIVYGFQQNAIQRMLDFDYACRRKSPSVAAIVNPDRDGFHKVFWGRKETLIPMYRKLGPAAARHPQADVMINFASFRSACETSLEALELPSIRTVVIIAEGVPERQTRLLAARAKGLGKWIIGPATVGGIAPGRFKIGNTGGTLENIIESKLHRPGSVGFVSKSGGMSNEAYNIVSRNADGIVEGIAIGGDKYPGSTLLDHILRFEQNPAVKMIVALGEVGGEDEYEIVAALKERRITKPFVVWVTGTVASLLGSEVQFGHAGARAGSDKETAVAKNRALREAGAIVPDSFDDYGDRIRQTYEALVADGTIVPAAEPEIPPIPEDYKTLAAAGRARKPTEIMCTISDDSGEEPVYAGLPISEIIERSFGVGDMISLLWFKKRLPPFAAKFLEMVLVITADHGPCVSGAHNAIVTARAGKDLMSCVASGVLTIGPRFGGAVSDAARYFREAKDAGRRPADFVREMKAKGVNIPGIGHRIKSVQNPDMRVVLLKKFAKESFPATPYLDYALDVEAVTTSKRNNLILNVDGCIGILFLDLMASCGRFTEAEIDEVLRVETLNGLFVLGRTIGMMGHVFDQKRLRTPMYRHPMDDVFYNLPSREETLGEE